MYNVYAEQFDDYASKLTIHASGSQPGIPTSTEKRPAPRNEEYDISWIEMPRHTGVTEIIDTDDFVGGLKNAQLLRSMQANSSTLQTQQPGGELSQRRPRQKKTILQPYPDEPPAPKKKYSNPPSCTSSSASSQNKSPAAEETMDFTSSFVDESKRQRSMPQSSRLKALSSRKFAARD